MLGIFQALLDRIKALFISTVALDFEAQFVASQAGRKADLLRQADEYASEGLQSVARDLREQAEAISLQRPLATVLPAVGHLQAGPAALPLLPTADSAPAASKPKKGGHR